MIWPNGSTTPWTVLIVNPIGNHYVQQLAENVYLLDVTYVIVTNEPDGILENVSNARFLVIRQNGKLLMQSMHRYWQKPPSAWKGVQHLQFMSDDDP